MGASRLNLGEMEKEIDKLKTWKMKVDMLIRSKIDPNFEKVLPEGIAEENPKG